MNQSHSGNRANNVPKHRSAHSLPTGKYDDIIHLPRPTARNHKPMSRDLRAAQFAPYATLTGHKDILKNVESENEYQDPEIIPNLDDYNNTIDIS